MHVKLARPRSYPAQLHGVHADFHFDERLISEDSLLLDDFVFNVVETSDSSFSLLSRYSSRGSTEARARLRASRIEHRYWLQDSTLFVDPVYQTGGEPWRIQRVELELRVPAGKKGLVDVDMLGLSSKTTTVKVHHENPYVETVKRSAPPLRVTAR
jgi:hypothetical protein